MIGIIRNVLTETEVGQALKLYKESNNSVLIDGEFIDRYNVSNGLGIFLLSHFNENEFIPFTNKIITSIQNREDCLIEPTSYRILKYSKGCFIKKHIDLKTAASKSNLSIIVQLSSPEEYIGGEAIIHKEKHLLSLGDLSYYSYKYEHEVKPVHNGSRYVINIRAYTEKKGNLI